MPAAAPGGVEGLTLHKTKHTTLTVMDSMNLYVDIVNLFLQVLEVLNKFQRR